jgi:UDP-4-amino-4,6-dideoxy-N-acetyl-beta-L-altrosamine transaminase
MRDPRYLPYARQLVDEDDIAAVVEVLRTDWLTSGPKVAEFETALARTVGSDWAVAVGSGTAALHAACFAAGFRAGDEVVVPAITFVATANCVCYMHAKPVFADVDPDSGLVAPDSVAERVTRATRGLLAVHLGGASADVTALASLARQSGATLIEDAAHALGGARGGIRVGACTDGSQMATFSFHPVKHITTGEGGAVTGNDPELRHKVLLCRDHGIERAPERFTRSASGPWHYEQQFLGHNLRLSDIQAALGCSQLRKLARFVARRRLLAERYDRLLRELPGVRPAVVPQPTDSMNGSVYHLYSVLIEFAEMGTSRAEVMEKLRERGIGTQVHYIPLPMQPYYRARGWDPHEFPGALRYYERTLSLPMFPGMQDEDVDRVVEALRAVLTVASAA